MVEIGGGAAIEPFTLHDLRRLAATGMAGIGIAPHVVDKILNHVSGAIRGVAAIYNRHAYIDERKAANRSVEPARRKLSGFGRGHIECFGNQGGQSHLIAARAQTVRPVHFPALRHTFRSSS
jgi:hypothetical protein